MDVLTACMFVNHVYSVPANTEGVRFPGMRLQTVVSHYVDSRTQTWALWKSNQCSEHRVISPAPKFLSFFFFF